MIQIAISIGLIVLFIAYNVNRGKKRTEAIIKMINSIEIGKEVMTAGGIYGTVNKVMGDTIEIRVDKGVSLRVSKVYISWVEE